MIQDCLVLYIFVVWHCHIFCINDHSSLILNFKCFISVSIFSIRIYICSYFGLQYLKYVLYCIYSYVCFVPASTGQCVNLEKVRNGKVFWVLGFCYKWISVWKDSAIHDMQFLDYCLLPEMQDSFNVHIITSVLTVQFKTALKEHEESIW